MADAVLAVVEGDAGGVHPRTVAATALAQRLALDTDAPADLVVIGGAPAPPGRWRRHWRAAAADGQALMVPLTALLETSAYAAVALGDTPLGRELGGRLAARLGLPVAGSVLSLRTCDGFLEATRPAAGGSRTARLLLAKRPALFIAHPEASAATANSGGVEDSAQLATEPWHSPFRLVEEKRLSPWELDVSEAEVIVAGGRGVGGTAGFEMLAELAGLLGGAVGASRVAVDAGWAPYSRQIGLTGKTVSPRLYVACGISGAIHHTLGMRESSFIVAVNSDAQAPILKIANVGIVGDVSEVVPSLIAELRARRPEAPAAASLAGTR